jgi:ABC-type antimicrobial peptide transport system ATPase subunit
LFDLLDSRLPWLVVLSAYMMECLLVKTEVIQAKMDANQAQIVTNQRIMAKMNAKMDAWIEEMEACVGKLETNPVGCRGAAGCPYGKGRSETS